MKTPHKMIQQRTPDQNVRLHTLLHRLGLDLDAKEDLVSQYTDGRTVRSSEMNTYECDALIRALAKRTTPTGKELILDRKRKRVIAHLTQAGLQLPDGRPDMGAIHAWVEKQKFKKRFNKLTDGELSKLIYASRKVLDHHLSKV